MSAPTFRRRRSRAGLRTLIPSKRWLVPAAFALALAFIGYAGWRVISALQSANPNAGLGDIIGLAINQDDSPGTLAYKLHHNQRVNFLLMGYGGGGHDGAYLTDSLMVISVEGTDRVSMTSIPRDTFVKIKAFKYGGEYDGKINAAYELPLSGGAFGQLQDQYVSNDQAQQFQKAGQLASKVVGDYLGTNIDYFVGLDFTAFKKLVDAVGGVDVVNPYVLDDWEYPQGETNGYTHIHFDAGPQHLNGDRALIYVRERHADNDFGRSRRQQQVLAAIKDKALSVGAIPHLFSLLDALHDDVKFNMSLSDLRQLSSILDKVKSDATHRVSIDNTNFQIDSTGSDGAYILLPRDDTMTTLHHFIDNELPDPAVLKENANVEFAGGPGQISYGSSLASIWAGLLHMLNFQTLTAGSVPTTPDTTEIRDYSNGKDPKTLRWLERYFNGTIVTETGSPPSASAFNPTSSATPGPSLPADIVVVLGKDVITQFNNRTYTPAQPTYVTPTSPNPSPTPFAEPSPSPSAEASFRPLPSPKPLPSNCSPLNPFCHPSPAPSPSSEAQASPQPQTSPNPSPGGG